MANTTIADIIDPEVLADQLSAKYPDMLVLGNTNLVQINGDFPLGVPGTQFKIPFWHRIGAFSSLTEGVAMTPGVITSNAEYATVQRAGLSMEVLDTAELVSKADPVAEIAGQIGRRAAEFLDAAIVTNATFTPNTFDQTGNTSTSGKLDQNAVASALQTLGDNYAKLQQSGMIIMHSKPYFDLIRTGAIQNQYQSGLKVIQDGFIGTLMGLPIMVSDLVPTSTQLVSGVSTPNYTTFIVGPDALALYYQRQVMVEFDRDILLQADVVASSVHFATHLFGYDDKTSTVVAEQNKSIHVVSMKSL